MAKAMKAKGKGKMMMGKKAPGARAPSGSDDKMINRMGGGKVMDRGIKK